MQNQTTRPVIIDATVGAFLSRYQEAMKLADNEADLSLINAFAQNFILTYGGSKVADALTAIGSLSQQQTRFSGSQVQTTVERVNTTVANDNRFYIFDALLHQLEQARTERKRNKQLLREKEKMIALGSDGITRANRLADVLDEILDRVPAQFKSQLTEDDFNFLQTAAAFSAATGGFNLRDILDAAAKSKAPFRVLPPAGDVTGTPQSGVLIFVHDLIGTATSAAAIDRFLNRFPGVGKVVGLYYNDLRPGLLRKTVKETITKKIEGWPEAPVLHYIVRGAPESGDPTRKQAIDEVLADRGIKYRAINYTDLLVGIEDGLLRTDIDKANEDFNRADTIMDPLGTLRKGPLETTGASIMGQAIAEGTTDSGIFSMNDPLSNEETRPVVLWAHIHRLRAEAKGPDNFETWRDAAEHERQLRVTAELRLTEANEAYALEISLHNEMRALFDSHGQIMHLPTIQFEKLCEVNNRYMSEFIGSMNDAAQKVSPAYRRFEAEDVQCETDFQDGATTAHPPEAAAPTPEGFDAGVAGTQAKLSKPHILADEVEDPRPVCMCPRPNNRHPVAYLGAVCPGCSQAISVPPSEDRDCPTDRNTPKS